MLDDLKWFITCVNAGSLTKAAEQLGTTTATVSRRLDGLEQTLGRTLLFRSSRGLKLTSEGNEYFQACSVHLHALDEVIKDLDQNYNQLSGSLRVLVTGNFAITPLGSFWPLFAQHFPDIELRIDAQNQVLDLRASQADVALRIGRLTDDTLIQRRLGHIQTRLVASPSFIERYSASLSREQHPRDLATLPSAGSFLSQAWKLQASSLEGVPSYTVNKHHRYVANDLQLLTSFALTGQAMALLPFSQIYDALNDGTLIDVLPSWQGQPRDVYFVWPTQQARSARCLTFEAELEAYLKAQPWFTPSSSLAAP